MYLNNKELMEGSTRFQQGDKATFIRGKWKIDCQVVDSETVNQEVIYTVIGNLDSYPTRISGANLYSPQDLKHII